MTTRIKLRLQALLRNNGQKGLQTYTLILAEEEGNRCLPIIVGRTEAQSIAIMLEGIIPPRPLTHDLFVSVFLATGTNLEEVFISRYEEGVYYSELLLCRGNDTKVRLDSRTSDAIAIALRMQSAIYTTPQVMLKCGIVPEKDMGMFSDSNKKPIWTDFMDIFFQNKDSMDIGKLPTHYREQYLRLQTTEELQKKIDRAVAKENYEQAQIYRNEIQRREEGDKA